MPSLLQFTARIPDLPWWGSACQLHAMQSLHWPLQPHTKQTNKKTNKKSNLCALIANNSGKCSSPCDLYRSWAMIWNCNIGVRTQLWGPHFRAEVATGSQSSVKASKLHSSRPMKHSTLSRIKFQIQSRVLHFQLLLQFYEGEENDQTSTFHFIWQSGITVQQVKLLAMAFQLCVSLHTFNLKTSPCNSEAGIDWSVLSW